MSSVSTTQYYGLTQYVGTDKPSFLDNNEAFAAVDAALHGAVTDVASQGETISGLSETVGTLGETVTGLGNDLDTEKGKIVALQNKEELQDTAIAGVKTAALDMICAYTEASATSTHAYAIGDYFRYQDVLYQATSAIEIGDTIVPNVNCSATNVAEELSKVSSAANIALAPITGMTADDVQEGIEELHSALNRGSVSVTADGVKTLGALLDELYALIDNSKLTPNSVLKEDIRTSNIVRNGGTYLEFGSVGRLCQLNGYVVEASGSTVVKVDFDVSASARASRTSEVPTSGKTITLYY